jgi:hypothetical protein
MRRAPGDEGLPPDEAVLFASPAGEDAAPGARTDRRRLLHVGLLITVLAAALALRLTGLDWDEGHLFHPDERQILMVAGRLRFPWETPALLLSAESPWNPQFFSYGSLPIYLLRVAADLAALLRRGAGSPASVYVVGRALSALADVGTVGVLYLLGRRLYGRGVALGGAALAAGAVLHIQLSHFYAVDTLLTLLVLATLTLAVGLVERPTRARGAAVGIVWGAALATKVSAAPLAMPIALAWVLGLRRQGGGRGWRGALGGLVVTAYAAWGAFALLQPYALLDPVRFLGDVTYEAGMASGAYDVPYTRQFAGTPAYLYPLGQLVVWALGAPLGAAGVLGAAAAAWEAVRAAVREGPGAARGACLVPLGWLAVYGLFTGSLYAKFVRYLLPIVPLLCLYAAWGLGRLLAWGREKGGGPRLAAWGAAGLVGAATALYAVGYLEVYRAPHPWVRATAWICAHVPPGSHLLVEHWDDPLPIVSGREGLACGFDYAITTLPVYDPDTPEKAADLAARLAEADYVILSSSRLHGVIPRLPERYPVTSRYYRLLFAESLGYDLVHYEATYPRVLGWDLAHDLLERAGLPAPRLWAEGEGRRRALRLGWADESFFVYDHPTPLVFRRTVSLSPEEIATLLGAPPGVRDGGTEERQDLQD